MQECNKIQNQQILKSYLVSNSKNARHSRKQKYNQRTINKNSARNERNYWCSRQKVIGNVLYIFKDVEKCKHNEYRN